MSEEIKFICDGCDEVMKPGMYRKDWLSCPKCGHMVILKTDGKGNIILPEAMTKEEVKKAKQQLKWMKESLKDSGFTVREMDDNGFFIPPEGKEKKVRVERLVPEKVLEWMKERGIRHTTFNNMISFACSNEPDIYLNINVPFYIRFCPRCGAKLRKIKQESMAHGYREYYWEN